MILYAMFMCALLLVVAVAVCDLSITKEATVQEPVDKSNERRKRLSGRRVGR